MSDSGENFDIHNISDSDDSCGYVPVAKKSSKVVKVGSSAPKGKKQAVPKKNTARKPSAKKILKPTHDNGSDSGMELDDMGIGPERPPTRPIQDEESALPVRNKSKDVHEKYQVLDAIQHILKRPDSYVGSLESIRQQMWVFDRDSKRMVFREVKYSPAFLKIFDEILVNAADNKINDPLMDTIKVNIDVENNRISVHNNGSGIPIVVHKEEKVYIPQMIFGQLLSSSNYDDDEKKVTGGRNGYGAKLTNIYSTEFTIETADKSTSFIYKQTWNDNMGKCGKPKITKNSKNTEYTRVSFCPDLRRFNMECIDADTEALLMKRVYDMAGSVKDVKVWLNDERLKVKGFKAYVEMYLNSAAEQNAETGGGAAPSKPSFVYEQINPRWEVAFALSEGSFQQISFANSISTTKGGTHVNMIADQITKNVIEAISKKNKGATVKPAQIKNHMWIFVNALIENPTFDSQTKETLTLPASKFGGGKAQISQDFLKKVAKSGLYENILNWAKFKADQQAKKTDGSKRTRLTGLTKLSDANNAGGRQSSKCTLILTEGDSAKALAIAGLAVVGRDNFGVFPLRGKLLNVREASHETIMKNEEIQNIKKIVGLQHSKHYSSTDSLRYGSVMIMTDQDHDGSHIKGLLINFLDYFYPSLLKIPNFLVEFVTPIVRVFKKKNERIRHDFFTIHEFTGWFNAQTRPEEWRIKYYKGLGTSEEKDAREYFSNMEKHMISFRTADDGDRKSIELAFSKKQADARKEWLRELEPDTYLNHDTDEITIQDFVNKELILFSMADNVRSIPSVVDGLKPGQRKVIWGCIKRNLTREIKVAQLCGAISEMTRYHHGEDSLVQTIVNLAQDFVGSNNINLLKPNGQYGTRDQGGKDHASARYIHTELSPITRRIFHAADDPLLDYLVEEGDSIEPQWYMPVIPHVLINGAEGIGTGWSTSIPNYSPADIIANIKRQIMNEPLVSMAPWWRGFRGTMIPGTEGRWTASGIARKIDDTTVEITELPVRKWTQDFKKQLEQMIEEKVGGGVKDYKEYHDNMNVHFIITMSQSELSKAEEQGFEEYFKLSYKFRTANMICFDFDGKIKKFDSPEHILEEFYPRRLAFYQKRKDYQAELLQKECDRLSNQARFVQMIVDKELSVSNRKKADIVKELRELKFTPFPKVTKARQAVEKEPIVEELEARAAVQDEEAETGASSNYDYLLGMAIWSLTVEKIMRLKNQIQEKETELRVLLNTAPVEMWNKDLDDLLIAWEKMHNDWLEGKGTALGSSKKKSTTLRTRKSLGKSKKALRGDSDDEFMPSANAPKAKVKEQLGEQVKPRRRAVKQSIKSSDSENEYGTTRKLFGPTRVLNDTESEVKFTGLSKTDVEKESPKRTVEISSNDEETVRTKRLKKTQANDKEASLETFFEKVSTVSAPMRAKKVKSMQPRSPPKPKKVMKANNDDESSAAIMIAPKKRSPRRMAKAPVNYIEVSSEGDWNGGNDDESFTID